MSDNKNTLSAQISIFLVIVFGGVLLSLVFVAYNAIRLADEKALERQERFAARSLASAITIIPQQQRSATVWDDAIENIVAGNENWMDDNLGVWMQDYFGHHENYILDQTNAPLFASVLGSVQSPEAYFARADAIAPLVSQLREIMADASVGRDNPFEELADVEVVAPLRIGDRVSIVSVVPVISNSGEVVQRTGTEALHVAVRYVDAKLAQDIAQSIELEDASLYAPFPPHWDFACWRVG